MSAVEVHYSPQQARYTGTQRQARVYSNSRFTYPEYKPQVEESVRVVEPKVSSDEAGHIDEIRNQISGLWARDWNSDEDSIYDKW